MSTSTADTPAAGDRRRSDGILAPERRALTAGLVATVTLVAFQGLAIATAMPLVARDLGGLELYGWAFSAFFLANLLSVVATGVWIDRRGLVEPFLAAIALTGVGLALAGAAPSMPVLVAARIVQGLGAGAIAPIAYVAIGRVYPEAIRPRMFATMSTAWVLPAVLGPAIAGEVATRSTWRLVFLGLLPLLVVSAIVTLVAFRRTLPRRGERRASGVVTETSDRRPSSARRSLVDAVLVTAGAGLLVSASTVPGTPLLALGLAVAGTVIGLPALARVLPRGTLRAARGLPATILLRGVLAFAFFSADAYLPLALVDVRGTSATFAGLALTGASVTWTVGSWIQARYVGRWGPRRFVTAGHLVLAAAVAATALAVVPDIPPGLAIATWTAAGLGMGLAYAPVSLVVLRDAPPAEQGFATAALQLSDGLGVALGTGLGGAVIAAAATADGSASAGSLVVVFLGAAVTAALGALLARRMAP